MARLQTTLLCLNCPWIQKITATLTFLTARRGKTANLRIRNVFHTKLRKSSALIDQSIDLASLQTAMETKEPVGSSFGLSFGPSTRPTRNNLRGSPQCRQHWRPYGQCHGCHCIWKTRACILSNITLQG